MPFTPKNWIDAPNTSTPISAAALEDVETRLAAYADSLLAESGGTSPSTPLQFDTDITLLNGWGVVPDDDGEPPARAYVQGGRVYLEGFLVGPSGGVTDSQVCELPIALDPELFGGALSDYQKEFVVFKNGTVGRAQITTFGGTGRLKLFIQGVTASGAYVSIDSISYPAAT